MQKSEQIENVGNRNIRLEPINSSITKDAFSKFKQRHFKNSSYNEG